MTYGQKFEAYGESHMRWIENPKDCGLRFVGYADKFCTNVDHTGWYTDDHGFDEKVRGVIYQLPARNGHQILVPGYADPWNDGAICLAFSDLYECPENLPHWSYAKSECGYAADRIAERMAEPERDYRWRSCAGFEYSDLGKMIKSLRQETREMIAEIRTICPELSNAPRSVAALKSSLQSNLRQMQDYRERRAELRDEYQGCKVFLECAEC